MIKYGYLILTSHCYLIGHGNQIELRIETYFWNLPNISTNVIDIFSLHSVTPRVKNGTNIVISWTYVL